jgi:hypothetical protein
MREVVQFLYITGKELREGQRVAWARTRGGTLALGTVLSCETVVFDGGRETNLPGVYVTTASNNRTIRLPYDREKFVVLAEAQPYLPPLVERVLAYMQQRHQMGQDIIPAWEARLALGLPATEAAQVNAALELLTREGEVKAAAFPLHAYTLA